MKTSFWVAGEWDSAHSLVQQYEDDATAAWIHAVLHKIEGDLGNTRYWYRRADRMNQVDDEPRAELAAIRSELTTARRDEMKWRRDSIQRKDAKAQRLTTA